MLGREATGGGDGEVAVVVGAVAVFAGTVAGGAGRTVPVDLPTESG
jgi:hypothetical protein